MKFDVEPYLAKRLNLMQNSGLNDAKHIFIKNDNFFIRLVNCVL